MCTISITFAFILSRVCCELFFLCSHYLPTYLPTYGECHQLNHFQSNVECFVLKKIICFSASNSVTRLGNFWHFGQLFKAGGKNYFAQIAHIFSTIFEQESKSFIFLVKSFLGQLLNTFGDILLVMLGPSNPIEYFLVQSSLLLLLLLINGARFGYMTNIWLKKPTCLPRIIYVYKQKHIFPAFVCGQWSIKPLNPSNYSC